MTRPTIENIRSVGDFLTLFRWNVNIIPPPAMGGFDDKQLNFRCETTDLPKLTDSAITVNVRGHQVKQTGIHSYSATINMQFVETVDVYIHRFIRAWRELCWKTQTGVTEGPKSAYESPGITMTRLDNQDKEVWEYRLIGAFLEDYDMGTLDGASSDAAKPTVIFSYDYFTDGPVS